MATYVLFEGTLFVGQTPDPDYMVQWVKGGTPYRPERWARDQDGCTWHPMPPDALNAVRELKGQDNAG